MHFAFAVGNAGFARRCIFVSCMQSLHDHQHSYVFHVLRTFRLGFILVGQTFLCDLIFLLAVVFFLLFRAVGDSRCRNRFVWRRRLHVLGDD